MDRNEMLDRLVENALDFLFQAVYEVNDHLKYSVIHFYAAVELFVKARLMHEHWSLVISRRQDPDWNKFVSGDFQSASLDEAANRLEKAARSGLTSTELSAFKEVAKDRNKMVHFFHEAHGQAENDRVKHQVVKKQLKAWYFLHQLLTGKWSKEFSKWGKRITEVDTELRKLHTFLQVVFDNLRGDIDKQKEKGVPFTKCPSCGFESQENDDCLDSIYEASCLVCGLSERSLNIHCPDCGEVVRLRNDGFGLCSPCGKHLESDDVANSLIDSGAEYIAYKDGEYNWGRGNCSDCGGYHTVVFTENEEWICASCFGEFETMQTCEWCDDQNTGDMENSYVAGCNHCEGMTGWHRDD
ncbi:MAG: hypothetical protein AB2563_11530 [Candidatus Thiodiazotropha endolucinida]